MAASINRNDALSHLFNIPELDFSGDLFAERLGGPWLRLTLIAVLIEDFQPDTAGISMLVRQSEGKAKNAEEPDLQAELAISHRRVRDDFAPLAFLYDLRTYGGLAHAPNKARAAAAAVQLGLPEENWHRTGYLRLLNLVAESVYQIIRHLDRATQVIMIRGGLSEPE